MFADAAATQPIAQGAAVASGSQVFLRSATVGQARLIARADVTVPTGNVYLYDGNTPGLSVAQRLILAATADVASTASATAEFSRGAPDHDHHDHHDDHHDIDHDDDGARFHDHTEPGTTTTTEAVSPTSAQNSTTTQQRRLAGHRPPVR